MQLGGRRGEFSSEPATLGCSVVDMVLTGRERIVSLRVTDMGQKEGSAPPREVTAGSCTEHGQLGQGWDRPAGIWRGRGEFSFPYF
jgi:hypothetical protein